ncbi:MAG: hypothetical protein ACFHVJ_17475 [Aestuariibacter sp.]
MFNYARSSIAACLIAASCFTQAEITPDLTKVDYTLPEVKVSPDGKYLGLALVNEGRRSLVVVETETFKTVGGVNFGDFQDVGNFYWATDERLITEILHREEWNPNAKYYGELYSIDFDGKHGEMIYGFRAGEQQTGSVRKVREDIYGWARIVSLMPNDPKHILISSTLIPDGSDLLTERQQRDKISIDQMKGLHSTVHRLNIHTGKLSPSKARSPAPNAKMFANDDGELLYAIGGNGDSQELYAYTDDDWKLMNIGQGGEYTPLGFDKDYSKLVYIDNPEGKDSCVYEYSFSTQSSQQLGDICGVNAEYVQSCAEFKTAYAVKIANSADYQMLTQDSKEANFFASVYELFAGHEIDITSGSEDGTYWVVRASNEETPVSYYLYNGNSNQFNKLL